MMYIAWLIFFGLIALGLLVWEDMKMEREEMFNDPGVKIGENHD